MKLIRDGISEIILLTYLSLSELAMKRNVFRRFPVVIRETN